MVSAVGQNEICLEVRLWLKKVTSYKLKAEDLSAVWWENVTCFSSPLPSFFFSGRPTEYYSSFERQGFHDQLLILYTQQSDLEDQLLIWVKIRFYATWRIEMILDNVSIASEETRKHC